MDINKLLKIVVIIAIFIIAGSVCYYFVSYLPKARLQKEQDRLMGYKVQFQKDCNEQYEKIAEKLEAKDINESVKFAKLMCQFNPHTFDIDDIFTCEDGLPYILGKDKYVPFCIDFKMKEIKK